MGTHNPDLQRGLDSVFECFHLDWTKHWNPVNTNLNHLPHLPHLSQNNITFPNGQINDVILSVFNDFVPDVVFIHTQNGDVIKHETAKIMSEKSIVFNWTGDVRHPLPQHYIDTGKNVTATLFTNMNDVDFCRNIGIESDFLQVGFDSEKFNPLGKTDSNYPEIIFLGSNYPNTFPLSSLRYDMVNELKNEFGYKFGVYGSGWENLANGHIDNYQEEGMAYRSCKIAINLSHFAYSRYSSDRMFRMLGSGAFCLTHYFPDLEKDFVPNKEVVVWNSIDDLKQKIHKYLINNKERETIALKGCLKARTNFTWHHFAENLDKLVNKYTQKK